MVFLGFTWCYALVFEVVNRGFEDVFRAVSVQEGTVAVMYGCGMHGSVVQCV